MIAGATPGINHVGRARMMRTVPLMTALLCTSAGCLAPTGRGTFPPATEGLAEIVRTTAGKVGLYSTPGKIVIAMGDVTALIGDPYRAIQLSEMLDAPESLQMLHQALARDADGAILEARYEIDTEPGRFAVTIRLADGDTTVELSLSRIKGQRDVTILVTPSESARLAAALRGYLMSGRI